ncbi:MAG: hypothetical protein ABIK83_12695 [Candidatus Zixiibacteriota bacterium]
MKWEVDVLGDQTDLRLLQKAFSSDEFYLSEENGKFVLWSRAFEDLNDADAVRTRAAELVASLSGASRALLGAQQSLTVGGVTLVREDGTKNYFLVVEPATMRIRGMPVTLRVTRADGTVEEQHPADPVREWLDVAVRNPAVAKALRLRDRGGLDWVELYRLYEVIESDTPQSEIVRSAWATKGEIRRFKHTANSPAALGDHARHGKERNLPPNDPMDHSCARSLVGRILEQWISAKTTRRAP